MRLRWSLVLSLTWLSVAAAAARAQSPLDSAGAPTRDPRFEATVRDVAASLRCPVCQNNSVEDSPSLLAQDMKKEIRARLAAGETPDQVRSYFVSRYGEWVLTKPRAAGMNLSVWLLPLVALLGGALVVWTAVRRWVRQGDAPRPAAVVGAPGGGTPGQDAAALRARKAALQASLQDLEAEFAAGRLDARDLAMLTERDQAELTAVTEALRRVKKDAPEPVTGAARRSDASGVNRWMARLGWVVALGAFALVLVLSLRGSVAARSEGGTITGSQTASAAPIDMELQQTGPLDSLRIAQLEARVRRDSTDVPALIELGHLYLAQGMLEKAILVDTLAVRLQPDAPATAEAFAHIGMILWSLGQTDGGLKALDKALYLRPELPEALLYRGIIFFAGLQDMRAAAQTFEHYLTVAPPDANTARVRAMLNAARQAAAGQ
ncbi:MAG TPA: cytochrome c-type biogenesis protein CcmH [Gemmatimonadales bacterium]|nr:cytochrome c-type biogenesis protein CcmH [Gemmatimonadales bacterium]